MQGQVSLLPSALERGLKSQEVCPKVRGDPSDRLPGNKYSISFVTRLWWQACFYSHLSSGTGAAFPNSFCPSVCRGCGPQTQDTKVPYSLLLSASGWSLNPPREGVEGTTPFPPPSSGFPFAERLSAASSGSHAAPRPASSPGEPLSVAPPSHWVGRHRGVGEAGGPGLAVGGWHLIFPRKWRNTGLKAPTGICPTSPQLSQSSLQF